MPVTTGILWKDFDKFWVVTGTDFYEAREKALKDIASIRRDGVREGIKEEAEFTKKMLKKVWA